MQQIYFWNGSKVVLGSEFTYLDTEYCVVYLGDGELRAIEKRSLKRWEETWNYKEEQKRKARLEQWKACEEQIVQKMQDKAIKSLTARIKLSAFFGKGSGLLAAAVLCEEIEKLIKDDKEPKL